MASNRTPWGLPFCWTDRLGWCRTMKVARLRPPSMRNGSAHMLARLARWVRLKRQGRTGAGAAARGRRQIRPRHARSRRSRFYVGIVNTPVFGRGAARLSQRPATIPTRACSMSRRPGSPVPNRPRKTFAGPEVAAARTLICDDLLGDFPFVGFGRARAPRLPFYCSGFLRGLIDGPTPLHIHREANAPARGRL